MPIVIGVTFRSAGQIYQFDPGGFELHEGDAVIAPTQRGLELGEVVAEPHEVPETEIAQPLRAIKRKATEDDFRRDEDNRGRERRACEICAEKIQRHGLPMKLIEARYTFDRSRIVFYFSSEGRVDFRKLVRDLAGELKTRVELHQVGVRDEARLFGGFGPCGRPLCCATFLSNLHPVAIKMAKEQNLALNPLKISGVCGRLMCCLSFEYESYRQAKADMPPVGSEVTIPQGRGKVAEINVIKRTLTVALEDGTRVDVEADAQGPCACPTRAMAATLASAADEKPKAQRESRREREVKPEGAAAKPEGGGQQRPRRRPRRRSRRGKGGQGAPQQGG